MAKKDYFFTYPQHKGFKLKLKAEDGSFEITGYTGDDISPVIPQFVHDTPVTSIGYKAFYETQIVYAMIPEGIKRIDQAAFQNCKELVHVSLPSTLKYFDEHAFTNCDKLETIEINNNPVLTTLGDSCCIIRGTKLVCGFKNSRIPEGVEEIKDYAFACVPIENVTFPSTLKKIGMGAFKNSSLKKLFIPKNVEDIKDGAFEGCTKLEELEIEEGNLKVIPSQCFNKSGLKKVILHNSVQKILHGAFGNLKKVDIDVPASVVVLTEQAGTTYSHLGLPLHLCNIRYDRLPMGNYFSSVCSVLEVTKTNMMNDDYSIDCKVGNRLVRTELDHTGLFKKSYYVSNGNPVTLTEKNAPQNFLYLLKNYNDLLTRYYSEFKDSIVRSDIAYLEMKIEEMAHNPFMREPNQLCAYRRAVQLLSERNLEDKKYYPLLDFLNLESLEKLLNISIKQQYPACGQFLINYKKERFGFDDGSSLHLD